MFTQTCFLANFWDIIREFAGDERTARQVKPLNSDEPVLTEEKTEAFVELFFNNPGIRSGCVIGIGHFLVQGVVVLLFDVFGKGTDLGIHSV